MCCCCNTWTMIRPILVTPNTRTHSRTHTHARAHTHTHTHAHTHSRIRPCMDVNDAVSRKMHWHIYIYIGLYIYVCVSVLCFGKIPPSTHNHIDYLVYIQLIDRGLNPFIIRCLLYMYPSMFKCLVEQLSI